MDLAFYNHKGKENTTEHKATTLTQEERGNYVLVGCLMSGRR